MLSAFWAFNKNAAYNFIYMLTTNFWFIFLLIAVIGSVILLLKDQIDSVSREEHPII